MSDERPSQAPPHPHNIGSRYAGDVAPQDAWEALKQAPEGQLIDCRTLAEWNFVGVPDLGPLRREAIFCEWEHFPPAPNPGFVTEAAASLAGTNYRPGAPIFFLCRSGGRSRAAAIAMTAAGHGPCFNISSGFEGALDPGHHRGRSGWKAEGLPWVQG